MKKKDYLWLLGAFALLLLFACQQQLGAKPPTGADDHIRIVKLTIPDCG
jgi:hypothetical protein